MGSHAELMARGGIYHRLYQLQYEREELKVVTHAPAQKVTA
jgi:regulator of sirC expression with transglutaminase-like and TPR domain